jgi:hypothetical protein
VAVAAHGRHYDAVMGARLAVLAALLLVLTACGSEDEPEADRASSPTSEATGATPTPTPPTAPATTETPKKLAVPADAPRCKDVWVAGEDLPRDYKGCVLAGEYFRAEVLSCSSGQGIVRHERRFWAVRGGRISQARNIIKDKTYLDMVARCRG